LPEEMFTTVGKRHVAVDMHTGESFTVEVDGKWSGRFKIPWVTGKWIGSYSCPSNALADLKRRTSDFTPALSADQINDLYNRFQSSLVKNDPTNKYPKFVIVESARREYFLGDDSKKALAEMAERCGYAIQREIYSQVIPEGAVSSDAKVPKNQWEAATVTGKGIDAGEAVKIPRSIRSTLEFLGAYGDSTDKGTSVVVSWNPKCDVIVATKPSSCGEDYNKFLSAAFGKRVQIWGTGVAFSNGAFKDKLSRKRRRSSKGREADPAAMSDDTFKTPKAKTHRPAKAKVPDCLMDDVDCPQDDERSPPAKRPKRSGDIVL
jgi:hypothetical protein